MKAYSHCWLKKEKYKALIKLTIFEQSTPNFRMKEALIFICRSLVYVYKIATIIHASKWLPRFDVNMLRLLYVDEISLQTVYFNYHRTLDLIERWNVFQQTFPESTKAADPPRKRRNTTANTLTKARHEGKLLACVSDETLHVDMCRFIYSEQCRETAVGGDSPLFFRPLDHGRAPKWN